MGVFSFKSDARLSQFLACVTSVALLRATFGATATTAPASHLLSLLNLGLIRFFCRHIASLMAYLTSLTLGAISQVNSGVFVHYRI